MKSEYRIILSGERKRRTFYLFARKRRKQFLFQKSNRLFSKQIPCELPQITSPTLVICGTKDMIKESHTKEIAGSIPNARLTIIEGNHFIANKCPAEFNQAVDSFLRTV